MPGNYPQSIRGSNFIILFRHVDVGGEKTPVMAICGKNSRSSYLIPLANAYQFADSITGEPTDHLMVTVQAIMTRLSLGDDRFIAYELASAIVDGLPELVGMPPAPMDTLKDIERKAERQEAVITLNGQTVLDAS